MSPGRRLDSGSSRGRRRRGRNLGEIVRRGPTVAWRVARFNNRNAIAIAAFLGALHLVLALLTFLPQPHTGGDNAAYITLGQSLLQRHAYLSLYDPATPPHTQYPPVFPAILAAAMAGGLQPWAKLKVLIALFSATAVALSFLWVRSRRRPALALGTGVLLALSPGVLEQAHWILSDVPFWCFTMLAVWAFERSGPEVRGRFAIAVAATITAYFTRSAGLPLLLAAWTWLALRKRWKQLAVLAAVSVPLAFLWWLRSRAGGGVDYVSQFWFVNPYDPSLGRIGIADLFGRMANNGAKYIRIHMPILLTGTTGILPVLFGAATLGCGIFGWAVRLRRPRRLTLAELLLPLYIGLLLVWPAVWSGERFLLPVLPLILYYAGDGLVRIGQRLRPGRGFAIAAAGAGLVVLAMIPSEAGAIAFSGRCMLEYRTGERYPCQVPAWRDFFGIGEWARQSLPDGTSILTRKPRLFYVLSKGHPGRTYPFTPDPADLLRVAREAGARYVVLDHVDGLSQAYLQPAIAARPAAFCLMYVSPLYRTAVLGILPDAESVPDSSADASGSVRFDECPADYWSRAAQRRRESGR
jgi:hypothetical protein